ncbi:hypothetical protein [Lacibacter sediminis]|uniref:Uncharacterized protein n=1 Tax=Lacibacter sediminis TaxID=2760713 RepID=A0A7G5XKM3_9BACT|nr:hypothetical protein [Lacibacter sediminis]QNA46026.1 hypothetical protein H4075_07540 [Lacibacter sediminis]
MKKMIVLVLLIGGFMFAQKADAQININLGLQPAWGPAGYQHVDYYYLPDIETYYYVPSKQFIYLNNGKWIYSAGLPSRYRTYNLYNGYKVVVNEPKPYLRHAAYKVKYAKYKGASGKQKAIKYSNGNNGGSKKAVLVKGNNGGKSKGENKNL